MPLSRLGLIERRCAEHKLRMTGQRRVVLRILADATDHPGVATLHQRARTINSRISLSTVYRIVGALEAIGVLQRREFADGLARYEIASRRHHDHLVDVMTGRIIDFSCAEIERLQARVARRLGYRIVNHRLDIYVKPIQSTKASRLHRRSGGLNE